MRSETRGNGRISRQKPVATPKKRGRPRKVVPSVIEQMKASKDGPAIEFLRDYMNHDSTEILSGADPSKVYRWAEESQIPTRESQGYAKVTDAGVKTHFINNYVPPDGVDTRKANRGGLVLMEIPKNLKEWRNKLKDEKVDEQMQAFDSSMSRDISGAGSVALPDSDPFVQETVNRG